MNEQPKSFQNRELIFEKRPANLDIIKIGSRWAQVSDGGNVGDDVTIKWLDTNKSEIVYWGELELVECYEDANDYKGYSVELIKKRDPGSFTGDEIDNIFWDNENKNNRNLKMMVRVFGEYKKKDRN